MDYHLLERLRESADHTSLLFMGFINGPMWDKVVVPVIVGAVSAAGSSYATTIKLEERLSYVIKRLDSSEVQLNAMADDRSRVRVLEQDVSRLWDYIKRAEDRGVPARPR